MKFYNKLTLITGVLFSIAYAGFGQTGIRSHFELTFSQGKEIVLKENLQLLSSYYNINVAEAELQQRRLWNNPTFVWNADMYSVEKNTYFQMSNQKLIQLEYVFSVSGKRVRAIKQAKMGIELAKLANSDVIRGLLLEYSNSFTRLKTLKEKEALFNQSLSKYRTLIESYEKRLELGMISENDLIRLRSEYITLQNQSTENLNLALEEQSKLNTLLNFPADTKIIPLQREPNLLDDVDVDFVLKNAIDNRPDYQIAQKNIGYYEQELKIQKSYAIPDIKLGYQPHDKGSNYVRPYQGIVFEMGIPIFNRNQGEINKSKVKIEQSKTDLEFFRLKMENDIITSYNKYTNSRNNVLRFSGAFMEKVEELAKDATINFEKKNISLLQYIDYQRTFLDVKIQYFDILNNYFESVNELNFEVGKEITN